MSRRATILTVVFPAATWVFGGWSGLAIGALILAAWWVLAVPRSAFWALAVILMAAAPFALMFQGLPSSAVIGAGFGAKHLIAHTLVGASLALAAFAGTAEILGLDVKGGNYGPTLRRMAIQLRRNATSRLAPASPARADPIEGSGPSVRPINDDPPSLR